MKQIKSLLKYLSVYENKFSKEIAFSIMKYSKDSEIIKMAKDLSKDESIEIDLWEMESLVNPKDFEYNKIKIDNIGI